MSDTSRETGQAQPCPPFFGNPQQDDIRAGRFCPVRWGCTFARTYDPLNRVSQLVWPTGDVLTWTYDGLDRRLTRRTDEGRITFTYSSGEQIRTIHNELGERTTYAYDPVDREVRQLLDNGVRVTTTYDAAGQKRSVRNFDSTHTVISLYTYTYDSAGNRKSEWADDGVRTTYTYDNANQLTQELRETSGLSWNTLTANDWDAFTADQWNTLGTVGGDRQHRYDLAGNRTLEIINGERTTFTYNSANRLVYSLTAAGRTTLTFDADGNQQLVEEPNSDITTNTWTYENQLTQVELPDEQVITYLYAPTTRNSDELRISREDETGTVHYLWDAENIIRELDDTLSLQAAYTLAPMPYGDLVSQNREGDTSFYLFDGQGSTRQLIDDTQTTTDNYDYSAYGVSLASTGSTANNFQYVGELQYYRDEVTGTYSLRRRQYESELARFLSEDPIAADYTLYRYCHNHPTTATDPSGLGEAQVLADLIKKAIKEGSEKSLKDNFSEQFEKSFYRYMQDVLPEKGLSGVVEQHHIICRKFFDEHKNPAMSEFLNKIGVLEHAKSNITILPTKEALSAGLDVGTMSLHKGGHIKKYYTDIAGALEEIFVEFDKKIFAAADDAARSRLKNEAKERVIALQKDVKAKLLSGEIKLQNYDTPELRIELAMQIFAGFLITGMTVEEAKAQTVDAINKMLENAVYYRDKNIIGRYATAQYLFSGCDSCTLRWTAWSIDIFNPVDDTIFWTDVVEDLANAGVEAIVEPLALGPTRDAVKYL